jgi:hypothetical protein
MCGNSKGLSLVRFCTQRVWTFVRFFGLLYAPEWQESQAP